MFSYKTNIQLKNTDATGVLYFAEKFSLALAALEEYLKNVNFSLGKLIYDTSFLMPIVHAEADYFAPLRVGDEVTVILHISHIGKSSFTVSYCFRKGKKEVGTAKIIHVVISKKTGKSIPIPKQLVSLLQKILHLQEIESLSPKRKTCANQALRS
jgi:1,4-dihydroxy-2-naphthoyl-CoA hydrolase